MSIPAIFFTATDETARQVRLNHNLPREDVVELSSVDTLKMSTLWAIIERKEWDVALMDEFKEVYASDEEWTFGIPEELARKISGLAGAELTRVSREWASTDEMACDASDAAGLLAEIKGQADRALTTGRGLFLYMCL